MTEEKRFYEEEIKDTLLTKESIFGNLGETTVIFEKGMWIHKKLNVIADALVFSENNGIIGIEIKTERDSVKRLKKQMDAYSIVCDYVFVFCHDNHVERVEHLLNLNKMKHVGILTYEEFHDEALVGIYRQAYPSPYKKIHKAYGMLWKQELQELLKNILLDHTDVEMQGKNHYDAGNSTFNGGRRDRVLGIAGQTNKPKKQLIHEIVGRLGEDTANRLLCYVFINNNLSVERTMKHHYFQKREAEE